MLLLLACATPDDGTPTYTQEQEACADRTPTRRAYWGDLHVHGAFSFDAANYGSDATPDMVFAFARGEPLVLGAGLDTERTVQLARPLDFAAATDHGDFLGEVAHCEDPDALGYDADICDAYQGGDPDAALDFGVMLATDDPTRDVELCGDAGTGCADAAAERWAAIVAAADAADDRSSTCGFTAFSGYEYTNSNGVSNLHRNAVFRNDTVPSLPVTTFEAPTLDALWQGLDEQCNGTGCEVLLIPHNSNLSNGRMFYPEDNADPIATAALRARMEPLVEVFQHKGQSECRNGFGDPEDPLCDFEQQRPAGDEVCPDDEPGLGGMRNWGCTHRLDYVRNVLKEGLSERVRLGVNPYHLGFVASTDTHNGTAGLTDTTSYTGHVGIVDDTPIERLTGGNDTHDTLINNPGGLAGVWSVENSRDALFEAMLRGETFATSGPRIEVRLFAGWGLDEGICDADDAAEQGYADGVPMGGNLPPRGIFDGPLRLYASAVADVGVPAAPGVGLERLQVVKGWLDADGVAHESVTDLATGDAGSLDPATCDASGGADTLCATWEDPDFDPTLPAFWYLRAVEVPTCRWSAWECLRMDEAERPSVCTDGTVPTTVQQRAWSSPVWYLPG